MENEFHLNSQIPSLFPFNPSFSSLPIWNPSSSELNCSSDHSPESFFNTDRSFNFDSGLTSIVSSPGGSNSNTSNENYLMRELIGNEILPFSGDPGFAERAAKFSCFGKLKSDLGMENGKFFRVMSNSSINGVGSEMGMGQNSDSQEESTVSKVNLNGENGLCSKKRKSVCRGKLKDLASIPCQNVAKVNEAKENSIAKRSRKNEEVKQEEEESNQKVTEPVKDYIHVRARRGQATDSHSLAERVRREKIGERMKLLQDLVPGCNKVTGKALMLDEIINYVQSLQTQVECLSMKLSSVNTLSSKNIFQSNNSAFFGHQNSSLHSNISNGKLTMDPIDEYFYPTFDDDLQTIVQMGFRSNLNHDTQSFLGLSEGLPTKLEL